MRVRRPLLNIAEQLQRLETELLTNAVRKDANRVAALLASTFREFGSSGRVYTRDEIVRMMQEEPPLSVSLSEFRVELLADGVALVTYRTHRNEPHGPRSVALRSSIWMREADAWRMVFHQGTRVP